MPANLLQMLNELHAWLEAKNGLTCQCVDRQTFVAKATEIYNNTYAKG